MSKTWKSLSPAIKISIFSISAVAKIGEAFISLITFNSCEFNFLGVYTISNGNSIKKLNLPFSSSITILSPVFNCSLFLTENDFFKS